MLIDRFAVKSISAGVKFRLRDCCPSCDHRSASFLLELTLGLQQSRA
jgi:hypothetical protein